jgi:glyoxylase-like metal-dependent hydrolase (beta-lactamase superfamily II)
VYTLDVLIPTARFAFAVKGDRIDVLPEHRSPEAYVAYQDLKAREPVAGMTTFPNSLLLRGPMTIVVDPGLHLQNEPVVRALAARGLAPADVDLIALTHAHLDHAGACADLRAPVTVHSVECEEPYWAAVAGTLAGRLQLLEGDEGELAPGVAFVRTPGHSRGSVTYFVETNEGLAAICGDTIGPLRGDFDAMRAPAEPEGAQLLASWQSIRARRPALIVPGHVPPFAL